MAAGESRVVDWGEIFDLVGTESFAVDNGLDKRITPVTQARFSSGKRAVPALMKSANTAAQNATAIATAIGILGPGKGIVYLPVGPFELEGVLWPDGISFAGAGVGDGLVTGTTVSLPASPTNHMFLGTKAQIVGNWQGGGFEGIRAIGGQTYNYNEFTATFGTNTLTQTGHLLVDNDLINLTAQFALAAGLDERTDYHVISGTATTFQVSLTQGGAAVAFTDAGRGKQYFYQVDGFDFINLSDFDGDGAGTRLESIYFTDNYMEGFRYVFGNTAGINDLRDREVLWTGNKFVDNVAAIFTNEHPRLVGRNDFRQNIFAICGNIFDCAFNNQTFVRNVFDVWPLGSGSTSMGRSTFVGNLVIFPVNGLKISSNRYTISSNVFAASLTSADTTSEQFIILMINGLDGTINSNACEELGTTQKCANAQIMLDTISGTFSRTSIKTNTFTVYGLAVGFSSDVGNVELLALDDNTFRVQQGQILVTTEVGSYSLCSFNGNTVHVIGGYTDNLDIVFLASKSGRGYQLTNNKFKVESSVVFGTDVGSVVNGEFAGTVYSGNIHRNSRVTVTSGGNTVPNAVAAGFSDTATDTANLKTLNVFYA